MTQLFLLMVHKTVLILAGAVIAGEALALFVGTRFFVDKDDPWVNRKNNRFIWLDIFTGLGLIWSAARLDADLGVFVYTVMLTASFISHGYRDWEYLFRKDNRFCMNFPLFIMNNLKLVGLLGVVALKFSSWFLSTA